MQTRHVNIVAQFNLTGVGLLAESYFSALRAVCGRQGLAVTVRHFDPTASLLEPLARQQDAADTTLFFGLSDPRLVQPVKTRRVLWMMFESTRLPSAWIGSLANFDQIWVSSQWGLDVLRANGYAGDVKVVAAGVDADTFFPPTVDSPWEPGRRSLRILMVGKLEKRKGYDVALKALAQLSRQIDLTLVAKPDYLMFPERTGRLGPIAQKMGITCEIVSGRMRPEALAQLYRSGDVFLFPSRAEGFGLPCIEALAAGLPTIATCYSGQTEFLGTIPSLFRPIDFQLIPIVDQDYAMYYRSAYGSDAMGAWAEPSVDSIVEGVLAIVSDYANWRVRGLQASSIIRQRFSWPQVAQDSLAHLQKRHCPCAGRVNR